MHEPFPDIFAHIASHRIECKMAYIFGLGFRENKFMFAAP